MVLRLLILAWLGCLAVAGPVAWDDSKCAQECNGGTKYQYSEQTSYIYSFESSNELKADGAPELSMNMKATFKVTAVSKCEMVLQVTDVTMQHGSIQEASSPFIEELKRNPFPFSWNDGEISHVCPSPEDSSDVNNIKKAILSAFQNTMKGLEVDRFDKEVDVLGSCDTEYKFKGTENKNDIQTITILKNKDIATCSNHLKGETVLLASFYESSSQRQHLPFLRGESLSCRQVLQNGIVSEVECEEKANFKPLLEYGYVIETQGKVKIQKMGSEPASRIPYRTPQKESLVFKFSPRKCENSAAEVENILKQICENSEGVVTKNVAQTLHKLVYAIRGTSQKDVLERIYNSLKNKQLCRSGKALTIYIDALKGAATTESLELIIKLIKNGEIHEIDLFLWMFFLPLMSYHNEESIAALLPMIKKGYAKKQSLLGVSALTYKFCSTHDACDNLDAVKGVSSHLKEFLGDKCQTSTAEEETEVITALKAFGNLGYIGESTESIFECANLTTNKMSVRITAIEAFRRTPCSEQIVSKLLDVYKNRNEDDEIRIAALISLTRCATSEVLRQILTTYSSETSKQVEVFTWSYLENLQSTSDPIKAEISDYLPENIKVPSSTDITKFSRNFETSLFSELLNVGHTAEANIVHSKSSFLPRSASLDFKANLFGNQLDLFQVGGRVEDLEHLLEKLFGPRGLMPNLDVNDVLDMIPLNLGKRQKRSADSYKSKIEALSERLGFSRGKTPHGLAYFRILGHEFAWVHFHKDMLKQYAQFDFDGILKKIASITEIDIARPFLYFDAAVLFPSVTGRAYKLASNATMIYGLKRDGKTEIEKTNFPIPRINVEGRAQSSLLSDLTASFTIHSENYEPGVKVATVLNAGIDFEGKVELKDGRFVHVKLNTALDKQEVLSFKRSLYSISHNGIEELPKPQSYHLSYCTKYVEHILGVRSCATATIPHIYNAEGKPKIPFVREMEASLVIEKVDMNGYEFLIQLPEFKASEEHTFKFLLDTPNTKVDRKLSVDLTVKTPNKETASVALKAYNPFHSVDVDVDVENKDDAFRLKINTLGDKRRRYSLALDVGKDVKGARLVEYQPKLSITVPNLRPVELSGTIVFAKGRKEQITINLQSSSFDSPLTIKGNLAKEGDIISLDADWKLRSEFNISAFSQIHRLQSSFGNQEDKGLFLDLGHHYEPDGRSYESVTVNVKLENVELRDRLQFTLETKVLPAKHQDLQSELKWDFSIKPFAHLKNDFVFLYGESLRNERHVVRFTQITALNGDFDTFQQMDIENKLGITISCLDLDQSVALSAIWDFVDKPKLFLEAGMKSKKDEEISFLYDYKQITSKPMKLASEGKIVYFQDKYLYRNQLHEVAPHEYQGKAVVETRMEKQITIDYVYKIKSQDSFHHEFDGTVNFPGRSVPVQLKADLAFSGENLKFNSIADTGNESPYSLDVKLQRSGNSELALNTPYIEGNLAVESKGSEKSIQADFKKKGGDDRRVIVTGSVARNDISTLRLDILWDADKDSQKKVSINAKSNKDVEDGIEKYMLTAAITYAESINVDVTGKISTDIIRGPHFFRADFSGNMEPMSVECTHEIKDGQVNSVARYLRSNSEKLRLDMKGKYIFTGSKFELESGLFLTSPYKTFDGKEVYGRIMADSNEMTRVFISEYRFKPGTVIGYIGKFDYLRKRGYPGHVRSNLIVTVHQRPLYEGTTHIDYGNGKYSWKTSFTPFTNRKISLLSSFEHSAKFAAFHHSMATTLQYFQKLELNAVADLRNVEDAKLQSNLDINSHQLYDVNSTLKMRSMIDFDGQIVILSKITPSLRVFSKAQTSGQLTKYDMNLDVDSISLLTGSGELKKRKKGFNGDMVFKYKEKELLVLNIIQEAKMKTERNYIVKAKTPWRSYSSNVRVVKEKKGSVNYETKFCRNDEESCISIDAFHKEPGDTDEWQISYKRGDVDFSIERIRVSTKELSRFHTVIYKGDKRYGYDIRVAKEGNGNSLSLGIIIPSREIVTKTYAEFSLQKPRVKFEFSADARKHPERKLTTDIKFENHLMDSGPSKLDVIISHPIYEKPIELQLIGDYEPTSNRVFTAQISADYSDDPDDKIIGKLSVDLLKDRGTLLFNIYHKDEQHLDFVFKVNSTMNNEEDYFGVLWTWKDEADADQQAFMVYRFVDKERKFFVEYNRPNFVYRLDGAIVTPPTLLGETCEIDLTSFYNGEATKAKLITDYSKDCYKLLILNKEGVTTRVIELCLNEQSRKVLSLTMEGLDEEGLWSYDYSLDILRKNWRTLKFKQSHNTDFTGKALFQIIQVVDDLKASGVGTIPIYDSPRFIKIRNAFHAKLFKPSLQFFLPEVARFIADVRRDSLFFSTTLNNYYKTLPPLTEVKRSVQKVREVIRIVLHEVWDSVESYYKEYFKNAIEYMDKATNIISSICNNNADCKAFVQAYHNAGWKGICDQIQIFIRSLPGKIQDFLNRPDVDLRKFFDQVMTVVKAALRPLTKYRCGEIGVKIVQLVYQALEPHIQTFLDNLPEYYQKSREAIITNKYVIQALKLSKEAYFRIKAEVLKIDFEQLRIFARKYMEEYIFNLTPPSINNMFTLHRFDSEAGVVDFDIHFVVSKSVPSKLLQRLTNILMKVESTLRSATNQYSWSTILVKFKRGADLNFFPPYTEQAMIVGNQHFVTFDKAFYDFAGECAYLLSKDFEDGNFTFILKPRDGEKNPAIIALFNDVSIELNSAENKISVSDTQVELPYLSKDFAVSRSGSTIIIDDKHGVQVKCNLVHQVCSFSISGWYYDKTAGLLGTYNYEPADEFKRPKGQIANSASVHAKSWELKKGCKSNNLVPDLKINERSDYYKTCKAHFQDTTSPLAACFYEVAPDEYFQLCLRHLAGSNEKTQALCNVATAYGMECEKNYVELSLPSKCLTCRGPDGSTLQHGDKKKYEKLSKNSADIVFMIEDNECNKAIVDDLGNLARSIDRELQNDGYKDTMFGVVGYGGDIGSPQIYTVKGNTFFNSRDIGSIKDRIKLENKKVESSRAFEAMKVAATYLFRSDTAKSFVLLSCSACKYDYKSLQYPVIQQVLLERGISLHVIHNAEIVLRKSSSKEKDIIGADPDTVYHSKDVTQKDLIGEPALRSQVLLPKDLCVALSQDVNGSYFSTHSLEKASSNEIKNWRSVFARKFLKALQSFECQWCDCISTRDHIPNTVCQPCEIKRPRLPFSVCKSCALPRTVESFLSYVLQLIRK